MWRNNEQRTGSWDKRIGKHGRNWKWVFDSFRRTASTLINSAILNSNSQLNSNLLQNIMIQQQIFRIVKYILLCTKIILVCSNGFVNPIIKTEVSRFIVFPLKTYNSKFATYLENHRRLGFWRKVCRVKIYILRRCWPVCMRCRR